MAVAVSSDNQHWLLCIGRNFLSHLFTCKFGGDLSGRTVDRKKPKTGKTYIRENAGQFASRQEKKEFKQKGEKRRRNLMVSALLILLAVLGVFKYADFVIDNMNAVFYAVGSDRELEYLDLLLPMGISFYTFQSLGYLLDVYWEKIGAQKNFFKHLLFVSFFPQLVQDRSAVIPIYHRRCMKNMYLTKSR